jgi:hypothetical protein
MVTQILVDLSVVGQQNSEIGLHLTERLKDRRPLQVEVVEEPPLLANSMRLHLLMVNGSSLIRTSLREVVLLSATLFKTRLIGSMKHVSVIYASDALALDIINLNAQQSDEVQLG